MQTRRSYLAAASLALAGLAGCLSENDGPGGDTPDDPQTTAETTDGTTERTGSTHDHPTVAEDVTVTNPIVRKAVTHYAWPASTQILAPDGEQFVVATVDGPEDTDPPGFTLDAGGESYAPGVDVPGRYNAILAGRDGGSVLQNDHASGYLAFRVPSPLDVDDATIVRDDGGPSTPLPEDAIATLGRPAAEFTLDSLDHPDTVERPEHVDVSLTVTNTSDVDGRFLAGLHWPTEGIADDDETIVLEQHVAAGETTSFTRTLGTGTAVMETSDHPLTIEGSVTAERIIEIIVDETTTASGRDS